MRGMVIVTVLAFHSFLAYLGFLGPKPFPFDKSPFEWRAFPIVDSHRWSGFDIFCAWQDVYLMTLMFFLSALFTWSSLSRKGSLKFLIERFTRLGIPYVFALVVLMPIALYPAYRVTAADPSLAAYWQHYRALPFVPNGPMWFLWQLLALTVITAALYRIAPRFVTFLGRRTASAKTHPSHFFIGLTAASAIVYVPMAMIFTPMNWSNHGILAVQFCRPLHYVVYYLAGLAVGAYGLERGLLAPDGKLARSWATWLGLAVGFQILWMGLSGLAMIDAASHPLLLNVAVDIAFVLACASGGFFVMGACLRFATRPSPILNNLAGKSFGMYLFHYVFVVWLQYALLGVALFALAKAMIVLAGTLLLAWATTAAMRFIPFGSLLLGSERRSLTATLPPRQATRRPENDTRPAEQGAVAI
nr:acyltransferase [Acidisphaera sp. S103]